MPFIYDMPPQIQPISIKPRLWFVLIPLFLILVALIIALTKAPLKGAIGILIFCLAFLILLSIAYNRVEIIIDQSGLTSKTLFKTRHILWKNVFKTYVWFYFDGQSGNFIWHFETATQNKLELAVGMYSRKSLKLIAEAVVTHCPHAQIEPKIKSMASGKFPWYIF